MKHTPLPLWVLFAVTSCFAALAFVSQNTPDTQFGLVLFFLHLLSVFSRNLGLTLFGFLLLFIIFFWYVNKKVSFGTRVISAFSGLVASLCISFLVSYLFLFVLAFLQLNMVSLSLHVTPKIAGMETKINKIVNDLQQMDNPPDIVAIEQEQQKELLAISLASTGTTSYYSRHILPTIPSIFVWPIRETHASVLLVNNTLVITAMDPSELQRLSPILGSIFLQKYFYDRRIKSNPDLAIVDKKTYQLFRQKEATQKLQTIAGILSQMQAEDSSLSASLASLSATLAANDKTLRDEVAKRNLTYRQCLASGETQANCLTQLKITDTGIAQATKDFEALNKDILVKQQTLSQHKDYTSFYEDQVKKLQTQKNRITEELGVFLPERTIKIVLGTKSSHAIADYLETMVHEYLHYTSYISQTQQLRSSFFEEGLTEYFARNIIQENLHVTTNLGYPLQVKIITQMMQQIPESDFADIYFTKDDDVLTRVLDRVYGDGFYEKNQVLFETLQYTSDPDQALKLANQIMKKIGGSRLTEKDLISTASNL